MKIKKYLLYLLVFVVVGAIGVSIYFAIRDKNSDELVIEPAEQEETVEEEGTESISEDIEEEAEEEPEIFEDYYTSSSEEFTDYTFRCPEGWTISEEESGGTVMISNTDRLLSSSGTPDSEYIMIKVEDIVSLENGLQGLKDVYLDSADGVSGQQIEDFTVNIGDEQADIAGYYYKSGLSDTENTGDDEVLSEIDMMTYLTEGDYVYILKYMSSGIEEEVAADTFSQFLDEFEIGSDITGSQTVSESGSMNILILGVDSGMGREWGRNSARSDINMILHINLETYGATIVTIPRDLWVSIPGHDDGKINGAHAIGGPELAVETFEEFSGLDIDNYIITDFDGFIPLIDFLGGVTIEVNEDLADGFSNCYLSKGVHHLNGEQALALCRNRHRSGDGSTQGGAWAREREAAKVIKALYEQKTTLEKILALPAFANFLLNYTWTDMEFLDIIRLLPVLGNIGTPEIEIRGVPSYSKMIGNASAVVHYEDETAQMFEEIKNQ